ncbi:MAG: DUF2339 domain-containing protein [Nitrospina sp.]|nr:DUF2339 domain-containing protein [Nitrospina sp.]
MDRDGLEPLKARIEHLESMVRDLNREVADLKTQLRDSSPEPAPPPPPRQPVVPETDLDFSDSIPWYEQTPEKKPPKKPPRRPYIPQLDTPKDTRATEPADSPMDTGETWLSRIGIGLLLLGVVFLVKYSIDRGWITPAIRLLMGAAVGGTLVAIGHRKRESRALQSQILQGGGIAAFYIVGFAAYQMYGLLPHPVAFLYMAAVTAGGIVLSLRQEFASLSTVALLGGLATPFLLRSGSGNITGLEAYTCLLLAGAWAIFLLKGWPSLFYASFIGGWGVHFVALDALPTGFSRSLNHRIALQAGLVLTWLGFWWTAQLRYTREDAPAAPLSRSREGNEEESPSPFSWDEVVAHLPIATLGSALVAFFLSTQVWRLDETTWGFFLLGGAAAYGAAARFFMHEMPTLGWLNTVAATVLATLSFVYLFEGDTLIFTFALELAALHACGKKLNLRFLRTAGHVLFFLIAVWLAARVGLENIRYPRILNPQALTDLAVLALFVYSAFCLDEKDSRRVYLLAAYIGLMGWWVREIASLPNGNGWVSIAWGIQGTALFVAGLRRNASDLFQAGFITLLVVAVKLLAVDLKHLDTIWRILLFLGIGAAFLALSTKVRDLWKRT